MLYKDKVPSVGLGEKRKWILIVIVVTTPWLIYLIYFVALGHTRQDVIDLFPKSVIQKDNIDSTIIKASDLALEINGKEPNLLYLLNATVSLC